MILYDCSHTSHTGAKSGIQQLTRILVQELSKITDVEPVVFDRFLGDWRRLDPREQTFLTEPDRFKTKKRSPKWSHWQKVRGSLLKPALHKSYALQDNYAVYLTPEIYLDRSAAVSRLAPIIKGPSIAFFHDAIPLKLPQYTPQKTVEAFPDYMRSLATFDKVICISKTSQQDLEAFWQREGITSHAQTQAIPLGVAARKKNLPKAQSRAPDSPLILLFVSSLEGRKNHLTLLKAAEKLWEKSQPLELHLVGMLNRETGSNARDEIKRLQNNGHPLIWHGPISNQELDTLYTHCHATVYPSWYEGFGMPILESFRYGKPCIASTGGALIENTDNAACLRFDPADSDTLATHIETLIDSPEQLKDLSQNAREIPLKTWGTFATEVLEYIGR